MRLTALSWESSSAGSTIAIGLAASDSLANNNTATTARRGTSHWHKQRGKGVANRFSAYRRIVQPAKFVRRKLLGDRFGLRAISVRRSVSEPFSQGAAQLESRIDWHGVNRDQLEQGMV